MLDQLPAEILEEIIYYLIDLDAKEREKARHPYNGKCGTALSFMALSHVNSRLRKSCESFRWKTILFLRKQSRKVNAAHTTLYPPTRHVRAIQATVPLLGDNDDIDQRCFKYFHHLEAFLDKFSQNRVKHIRLYTPSSLPLDKLASLSNPEDSIGRHLNNAHRKILSSLVQFPLLTSLEINGACFNFGAHNDIAECVSQLPNLVRFRATSSLPIAIDTMSHSIQLGESLASLCSLEYLALQNLQYPDSTWADLNWKGPLKFLFISDCWNIKDDALYRFISKFVTLKKIRLLRQEMSLSPGFLHSFPILFQALESFTFLGISFENRIFEILSRATKLERLHVHLYVPEDILQGMISSIDENSWPSLKVIIFSRVDPKNEQKIFLENWCLERQVKIKFHSCLSIDSLEEEEDLVDDADLTDGSDTEEISDVVADDDEQFDTLSVTSTADSDDSELSTPEDWTCPSWIRDHE
ncbi:uncharacterized protein MELLADRAFT_67798 [Melampsora larici-populina 98AG31]|uniref:F-box domain-containing protein n=1 Tax=Melampsora larici-populina (strain 98AG31 / pathotype 3-4-7) TaxID=747676 RepID=F4S4G6_MELLP|nr:uncharacterized protein MELLADRAFT_67798 [Melampsora larici-populina 98AG31]EGG00471.1 hypothetical protein MELLADRAFT_67798 [Melampsora larici-populina 98AG31]